MAAGSHKVATTLKTIRMPKEQAEAIERVANEEGVTFNAVVNKVMGRFVEFNRFAEKLDFVSLPRETMSAIVASIDEKNLEVVAARLGERVPKEMILFRHKKQGISVFLRYLMELSKYHKVGEIEMSMEEESLVVLFHHDMGRGWSIFLQGYLSEAAKSVTGIMPTTEVDEDVLVLRLKPVSGIQIEQSEFVRRETHQ